MHSAVIDPTASVTQLSLDVRNEVTNFPNLWEPNLQAESALW